MYNIIKKVDYYNLTVKDQPGEAYNFLSQLATLGIYMYAFSAVPLGANSTLLTIFPEDSQKTAKELKLAGQTLDGPHKALLVQGDDELGALIEIHKKLFKADVNISAASGVSDGKDSFGYIIYLRPNEYEKAAKVLGL
jgi:hypothetical protein